jgi:CRP-like cAMP-binding protein
MTHMIARRSGVASTEPSHRPSLRAVPFRAHAGGSDPIDLLSASQQQRLEALATVQHIANRAVVYRAGDPADAVFIIGEGVVKSFKDLRSGRRRIAAFLFAHDMFGLAKAGRYVNTVQAIRPLTVFRLELAELTKAFLEDAELELRFLCKIVHELREAQHHAIIVARRHATGRIAMLLRMLEANRPPASPPDGVEVPMNRSEMADYLGLSLESVVRASRRLERQGIVDFSDRHHARVLDRRRFEALASAA